MSDGPRDEPPELPLQTCRGPNCHPNQVGPLFPTVGPYVPQHWE